MKHFFVNVFLTLILLVGCSDNNEPSKDELKGALLNDIPSYIEIESFSIEAIENFGNKVEPNFGTRFKATIAPTIDLYKEDTEQKSFSFFRKRKEILFVKQSTAKGNETNIFGKISSRLYQGAWKHHVYIDGSPIRNMGLPITSFDADRVIVRGSEDEKKYLAELERKKEELKRKKEELRKNIANAKKILVGKWKWSGGGYKGLSTYNSDGSEHELLNNGDEYELLWNIKGDIIEYTWKRYKPKGGKWEPYSSKDHYQIIDIDDNKFTIKHGNKTYTHIRVQ